MCYDFYKVIYWFFSSDLLTYSHDGTRSPTSSLYPEKGNRTWRRRCKIMLKAEYISTFRKDASKL